LPLYEYRCSECRTTFEVRRAASEASAPALCPAGHATTRRVYPAFGTIGRAARDAATPPAPCGPGCACAAEA